MNRFLWARLVIEDICTQSCDDDILNALKHLPKSLSELFNTRLKRVETKAGAKAAIKIFQYCGVSRRSLTVSEFRELLSVVPYQAYLNKGGMPNDMNSIISDCCGLAFVNEEDKTVHYVHQSLRDYLFAGSPRKGQFSETDLDRELGVLCMTYLNFDDFKRDLAKIPKNSGTKINPLSIGTAFIDRPLLKSAWIARKLIRFKQKEQRLDITELNRILKMSHDSALGDSDYEDGYVFLEYARVYWIHHLSQIDKDTQPQIWERFCQTVHEKAATLAVRPWEKFHDPTTSVGLRAPAIERIMWACEYRHAPLYLSLVESDKWTKNTPVEVLIESINSDRPKVFEFVLRNTHVTTENLNDLLIVAAGRDRLAIVTTLLSAGANTDTNIRADANAGFNGFNVQRVKRSGLMSFNDDFFVRVRSTALHAAAEQGHIEIVKKLISAGACVDEMMPTPSVEHVCDLPVYRDK